MPKGSKELTESRRHEIIWAARLLYRKMSFKDITIKDIADETSFTRTSIYNYFETKEEIFLSLLKEEYEEWIESLKKISEYESLSKEEFASLFASTLSDAEEMLKLLSTNLYDIEENSRFSFLLDLKKSYLKALDTVSSLLRKYFPSLREEEISGFIFSFFPFMYGVYPYTRVTEKQEKALKEAGFDVDNSNIKDFVYRTVIKLL